MVAGIIEQVVHQYFAGICAMDSDAWLAAFAADAVSHDPVGMPPLVGHAALRQAMQELCDGVEQVGRYADDIFVAGNSAAIKWTGRVYTITFQVTDQAGNSSTGTVTVSVAHNQ